tara:strand:- start:2771 stop:4234 length:1464 start_codon:yes stop_codon:yes gene_type:complete
MSTTSYGTGTAMQFSDASKRQILELGDKIHYYNPNVTPIFSLFGQQKVITPVPIFEWMEDEYMIKKSEKFNITTSDVADTATGGINGHNTILIAERQAQMEMFEVGGIYSASVAGGSAALETAVTHFICIAVGKGVNHASATDLMVQFLGAHAHASISDAYNVEACADGTDLITADGSGVLTLSYVANAGLFYDNAVATSFYGYQTHSGSNGFGEANFADADYFESSAGGNGYAEGAAVGTETRKKVRRLKNCTQIFREPYTITNTAKVSEHYGGPELSRLQARKLNKIKGDIEWAMLSQGAISLDASSENPKRKFQGLGVGLSTGAIQSLNGFNNSNLQLSFDSGTLNQMDAVVEFVFSDMISGGMRKTVFASNKWMLKLAAMTRSTDTGFYDTGEETKAGLRVRTYMGPVGELDFVSHPYLKGVYEDYAVAIDPANFSVRPLAGRDMQLRTDIVQDGRDGQTDEWLMEVGMEVRNEQTHAILKLT